MSERSCPVSGSASGQCPAGAHAGRSTMSQRGPRGCSFSGFTQAGDFHAAFEIPRDANVDMFLRDRERKTINDILYRDAPSAEEASDVINVDTLTAHDNDLLAVALGAPARQVMLRAESIGPRTGWKDGYLSAGYGFCPPDSNEAAGALASCPGRIWSDLCERMPGCVSRGRVRASVAALPLVEGTPEMVPDRALWAALVSLGMLCHIYRYEDKYDGTDGVSVATGVHYRPDVDMGDHLGPEFVDIPLAIALPYWQVSRRMGRIIPHQTFFDQSSYNVKIRDPTSTQPYVGRFDNMDLRWPMFGEQTDIAFLKGCAETDASFQHGPDAIAACQEAVMARDVDALLRSMVRLKEILERMPNAFHSISPNPNSGDNFVSAKEWVRWAKFSAPLSKRCPAASGLQFSPFLLMDAFLGRRKYDSFLGAEGVHLRAWLPSNLRAFIAAVEYHYRIPEFVAQSGDPRLMGVMDGIVEAYTGERGFMGVHRYKVFGILEVAGKTGRSETNGQSGSGDSNGRPWEETHRQFADAMKERLEPYRGNIPVEPHEMRGSFEECRYKSRVVARRAIDFDPSRSIAMVTFDIANTGITFAPGDRLAVMPLNSWEECAKVAAALGIDTMLDMPVTLNRKWARFAEHLSSVETHGLAVPAHRAANPTLTVKDILRRGHLAPLTKDLVLKIHDLVRASSNTVLKVLATNEWPVRGSLGDLLQGAVEDTPPGVWDRAFDLTPGLAWLANLIPVEVPRTYSISNYPDELLPSTVDLTVSRAEYQLCDTLSGSARVSRSGVSSGFLNPPVDAPENFPSADEEVLIGVSRPAAFQLPIDGAAPCAFFAGGSGIAPFRSFWQARIGRTVGRNILYLGVQSRDKFCYEEELRQYVNEGAMEVHLAFSRDANGLAYDPVRRDLVERRMEPRYIDSLIAEQGASVCDLVMSKRQGGLGGHLYICGSVSVFDSVMSGIRKAIYNHRTATMESTDIVLNAAFAERRIMLDVFMSPKPLPCNQATIPLSQLAQNTGHRPGGRIWLGVHGSAYDVTDFCPMHPGGTLIIKSNAGVDCSQSFDNLAHTNNAEVSSLLTKYFVGHLTPKPEFHACEELSGLYDMWAGYLRTSVETLVTQQFQMEDLQASSAMWLQGEMINMIGVRTFYQYQSRLLQSGFLALFGPKFQELVLKLSFTIANAASHGSTDSRLPDVLGIVARAKTSPDSVATSKEVSRIGQLVCDGEAARFQERGIREYAAASVELDIELLEDIRHEACRGMDAFDSIMTLEVTSDAQRVSALCSFLMDLLERMAKRLELFYAKLARHSIYAPQLETNPARTRWGLVRRMVRDGSLFVFAHDDATVGGAAPGYYMPPQAQTAAVEFDNVLSQIQRSIREAPQAPREGMGLNERHMLRAEAPLHGSSPSESHENAGALNRMSTFIESNMKAIRRISRLPPAPSAADFEKFALMHKQHKLQQQQEQQALAALGQATPPPSRGNSRSPAGGHKYSASASGLASDAGYPGRQMPPSPAQTPPPAALDPTSTIQAMASKMHLRTRSRGPSMHATTASPASTASGLARSYSQSSVRPGHRSRTSTLSNSSLRTFKLGEMAQVRPTF